MRETLVWACVACLGAGCVRTLTASVHAPNPLSFHDPGQRTEVDYEMIIRIKDLKQPEGMVRGAGLGGYGPGSSAHAALSPGYLDPHYLPQQVALGFASTDEVRFEVTLTDEWRELVHIQNYRVELRDDRGILVRPDENWSSAESHRDYDTHYQAIKNFQNVRLGDGSVFAMWAPEDYYVYERIYRAHGTVVFRRPALLRPDTRSLTLTLTSKARRLRFTWVFDLPLEEARGPGIGTRL